MKPYPANGVNTTYPESRYTSDYFISKSQLAVPIITIIMPGSTFEPRFVCTTIELHHAKGDVVFSEGLGLIWKPPVLFGGCHVCQHLIFFKHCLSEAVTQLTLKAASAHLSLGIAKILVKKGGNGRRRLNFGLPGRSLARKGMNVHLHSCTSHCHCFGGAL